MVKINYFVYNKILFIFANEFLLQKIYINENTNIEDIIHEHELLINDF